MDNRRSGPRSEISLPIYLKTQREGVERPVRLSDMSANGIALFSDQPLQPKSKIEVIMMVPYEISLTKTIAVKVPAEVLRVDESHVTGHHRVAAVLRPTRATSSSAKACTVGHA